MPPLTAAQVLAHPAYEHLDWDLTPAEQGKCEVAKGRAGGPFNLHYEVHGKGPIKLVWIMGLGTFRTAWKRQTRHFGHLNSSTYSSLVFDNRGMGLSDKPSCRYTTTEMAIDVIDLVAHLKWLTPSTTPRTLNIAGVSMGGMIAQELALLLLAPASPYPKDVINSLLLVSTAPRLVRTVPFLENLRQRINMFIPRDIDVQLEEIAHRLFSEKFLAQPDNEAEVISSTNNDHANSLNPSRDSLPPPTSPRRQFENFPTIRDRFAAGELQKRRDTTGFTRKGFILQAIAAGWHHKSPAQLKQLAAALGTRRIAVLHGTADRMITFLHAEMLRDELGSGGNGDGEGIEFRVWEGTGHVLMWEEEKSFNAFVEGFVEACGELDR